ncbi:MAG: ribonuclease III [Thermodesulfobacteriota bacterium]|nr:ribonuclease III [Thermodesulfobacteriota bacterium]
MTLTLESLTDQNRTALAELEGELGYGFKYRTLLQKALLHKSYAYEQGRSIGLNNETLEFLGDAVLGLIVGHMLFERFPEMNEGELTKLRSGLVKEGHLAVMAKAIGLGKYLLLGKGEDASNGREKPSILACTYEAVIGSIFLDRGYEASNNFVERHFVSRIAEQKEAMYFSDFKSRLQEIFQEKYNHAPIYEVEKEEGPDHDKVFTVCVKFRGKALAFGTAGSKKEAEQKAAALALQDL